MATQTRSTQTKSTQTKPTGIVARAREAGVEAVDAYEQAIERILDFQERAAGATQIDWIAELTSTQTKLVREATAAYTSPARQLLK
jgi:hypothetical protein